MTQCSRLQPVDVTGQQTVVERPDEVRDDVPRACSGRLSRTACAADVLVLGKALGGDETDRSGYPSAHDVATLGTQVSGRQVNGHRLHVDPFPGSAVLRYLGLGVRWIQLWCCRSSPSPSW